MSTDVILALSGGFLMGALTVIALLWVWVPQEKPDVRRLDEQIKRDLWGNVWFSYVDWPEWNWPDK